MAEKQAAESRDRVLFFRGERITDLGRESLLVAIDKTVTFGEMQARDYKNTIDNLTERLAAAEKENKQLRGEEPIPGAWWKDAPRAAQRAMERVIENNDKLHAQLAVAQAKCNGTTCVSRETLLATEAERDEALKQLAAAKAEIAEKNRLIVDLRKIADTVI